MDPVTAVSTAASILTFVDFSWKLVIGVKELYQSPSGQSAQDAQLSEIVIDLQQAADDLTTACHRRQRGELRAWQVLAEVSFRVCQLIKSPSQKPTIHT